MELAIGPFRFEAKGLNFDEITRTTQARWAEHEVIGAEIISQHLGPGMAEIQLPFLSFPLQTNGDAQIQAMAEACARGDLFKIVSGAGDVMPGLWAIESFEEANSEHTIGGRAQKRAVNLTLKCRARKAGFTYG